jgi:N-acetylneuraminic acid mutarotase
MATAREYHTTTLLLNGKVLVAGGQDAMFALASAELFDPAANMWTSAGNMAYQRSGHTATLLPDGRVLVVGGASTAVTELYDPVANTWTSAGSTSVMRKYHTATLLATGKVLIAAGGRDPNGCADLATAELYDPSSNAWSLTGSLAAARDHHIATLLPSGSVLITGGFSGCPYVPGPVLASAELFNPTTNTWSSAGSMATERVSFTASLLPNGKVLIAGGWSPHATPPTVSSAELYDPGTNTWAAAASMIDPVGRAYHTAIRLPFGGVLVVGGGDDALIPATTAELYW